MKKLTKVAIARHLFMSPQRLGTMITDGALPDTGADPEVTTLDDYRKLYITRLRKAASGHQSDDDKVDLTAERAALTRVQKEKIEMQNQVTRGELVLGSEVEEKWGSEFYRVRNKLLALPPKIAPLVIALKNPAEAQEIIKSAIYEVLTELSQPINEGEDDA